MDCIVPFTSKNLLLIGSKFRTDPCGLRGIPHGSARNTWGTVKTSMRKAFQQSYSLEVRVPARDPVHRVQDHPPAEGMGLAVHPIQGCGAPRSYQEQGRGSRVAEWKCGIDVRPKASQEELGFWLGASVRMIVRPHRYQPFGKCRCFCQS